MKKINLLGLSLLTIGLAQPVFSYPTPKNLVAVKTGIFSSFTLHCSGTGYVENGLSHQFSIAVSNALPSADFEVKFKIKDSSTASGSIFNNETVLTENLFLPLQTENHFAFVPQSLGIIDLEIEVKEASGASLIHSLKFEVRNDITTFNSGLWSNGLPDVNKIAIINSGNYTGNITAKKLQVNRAASLTVGSSDKLVIEDEIINYGGIVVENNGSIIQNNDLSENVGSITYKRITTPIRRYDFTYWGSPVTGQTLSQLSPQTLSDKFYGWNPVTQNWITYLSGNHTMVPAIGYIVRGPQNYSLTDFLPYEAQFIGTPNNGIFTPEVKGDNGPEEKFNLLSNPYPSAMDADIFLNHPDNEAIIGGTIYLWSHTTLPNSAIPGNSQYNYSADDYAKFNATGGVKTISAAHGGITPNGKIAAGQGFFVTANSNSTVTINNSMRSSENNQFFRMSANAQPLEKHRIWLKIENDLGAYDETLLGYVEGATDGIDRAFDGPLMESGKAITIYNLIEDKKFNIQGKALPNNSGNDTIPLGIKCTVVGQYKISLESFDGLFTGSIPVYLEDLQFGTTTNLKETSYDFSSMIGTFNQRFILRIPFQNLGLENPIIATPQISVISSSGILKINSNSDPLSSFQIYDMSGRTVKEVKQIGTNQYQDNLNIQSGIYIVKVQSGNKIFTTKIIH